MNTITQTALALLTATLLAAPAAEAGRRDHDRDYRDGRGNDSHYDRRHDHRSNHREYRGDRHYRQREARYWQRRGYHFHPVLGWHRHGHGHRHGRHDHYYGHDIHAGHGHARHSLAPGIIGGVAGGHIGARLGHGDPAAVLFGAVTGSIIANDLHQHRHAR